MKSLKQLVSLLAVFAVMLLIANVASAQIVTKTVVNPPGLFNRSVVKTVSNVPIGVPLVANASFGQTALFVPQGIVPSGAYATTGFGVANVNGGFVQTSGFFPANAGVAAFPTGFSTGFAVAPQPFFVNGFSSVRVRGHCR